MKNILLTLVVLKSLSTYAINYYVNPIGNNNNNGLTVQTAFQTLEYAANQTAPGDTVFVMNGTYTNSYASSNVFNIYNSGTPTNRIVYINYPGHSPIIKLNANNWSGIDIQGADYITIDGLNVVGNNDSISLSYALTQQMNTNNPATSGNGIGITAEYNNISNKPHHNVIRNCTVSKCGGAGIYSYRADYTTIENNTVFECGWYSPYGNSGISLYQNWNSDSIITFKNYIVGNTCYRNENYIPFFAVGSITDGNGIIIDDARNTQNSSTQGIYLGKTYIANNLIFDNGGRGIHVYLSDRIVIVNNTCYENCQSPVIHDGEFTAYSSDSILFINNIASPSVNIPPIDKSNSSSTNIYVDHNLWMTNSNLANPFGTNTITGSANFIFPGSNPAVADFHLQSTSIAINAGTLLFAPQNDKDGFIRASTDSIDIGCYEYQSATPVLDLNKETQELSIYPNPATNKISIRFSSNNHNIFDVSIHDSRGQLVSTIHQLHNDENSTVDISDLPEGIYFVKAVNDYKFSVQAKLVVVQK